MTDASTQEIEAAFHKWKDALNTGDLDMFLGGVRRSGRDSRTKIFSGG